MTKSTKDGFNSNKSNRLQLELSDTYTQMIERLIPLCDLRTKKDVVENALTLLGWAAAEASKGRSIASIDDSEETVREFSSTALEGASSYKQRSKKNAAMAM
ncbi:MAG: hypothetical protein QNI84_05570 [Henriciella sp.]|nr:hypothetical protein [Henriciella sp.]